MEYGAIDLHKKESQVRIITESGEVIDQRIRTTRDRLTALFWGRPHARILIEASTESEWVAQHLETVGHELDVWASQPTRETGSARCRGARRGVSSWDLSMRASSIVAPADGAVALERSARAGGGANSADLGGARNHSLDRLSDCRWGDRDVFDATRRGGSAGVGE